MNEESSSSQDPIVCLTCGAVWTEGNFSDNCEECGGGAMENTCLLCGGICGKTWSRMVIDSHDSHTAHWLGGCGGRDNPQT